MNKKVVKRNTEATLIMEKDMSIEEELYCISEVFVLSLY